MGRGGGGVTTVRLSRNFSRGAPAVFSSCFTDCLFLTRHILETFAEKMLTDEQWFTQEEEELLNV